MIPPPTGLRIRYCTSGVARRRPGTIVPLADLGSGGVIRCPHLGHLTPHADDLPRRGDALVQDLAWSELAVTIETETGPPCLLDPGGKRLPTLRESSEVAESRTALPRRARCLAGRPRGIHRPAGRRLFSERSAATGRVAAARARVGTVLTAAEHCRAPQAGRREMFGVALEFSTAHRARGSAATPLPWPRRPKEGSTGSCLSGLRARPGREEVRRPRALSPRPCHPARRPRRPRIGVCVGHPGVQADQRWTGAAVGRLVRGLWLSPRHGPSPRHGRTHCRQAAGVGARLPPDCRAFRLR